MKDSFLYSMHFVYLTWENKKGEPLKVLFQEDKAIKILEQMKKLGVNVELTKEITTPKVN